MKEAFNTSSFSLEAQRGGRVLHKKNKEGGGAERFYIKVKIDVKSLSTDLSTEMCVQ